ncbi:MAG: hypothetical protein AAFS04_11750 [Cyanobacteria bacterium J06631_9]
MPTKSKEQPTAEKSATAKKTQAKPTAQRTTRTKAAQKTNQKAEQKVTQKAEQKAAQETAQKTAQKTVRKATTKKTATKQADKVQVASQSAPEPSALESSTANQTVLRQTASEQTVLALPQETATIGAAQVQEQAEAQARKSAQASRSQPQPTTDASNLTVGSGTRFLASELAAENIWAANTAIPTLDEATYAAQKAQAEAQRRAIEVASLNLQNINDLHELERQSIDVAISAKTNEIRTAQLAGTGIDYQTQLEVNAEKSQHLAQAVAKHQAATRETGYADQLIALKDQNFELEIQQAQNVFAEKAARYRARLTGQ